MACFGAGGSLLDVETLLVVLPLLIVVPSDEEDWASRDEFGFPVSHEARKIAAKQRTWHFVKTRWVFFIDILSFYYY